MLDVLWAIFVSLLSLTSEYFVNIYFLNYKGKVKTGLSFHIVLEKPSLGVNEETVYFAWCLHYLSSGALKFSKEM